MTFVAQVSKARHSLTIMESLYQYDDFMESIGCLVDLGCGDGHDLQWWASATTREDDPQPLNIKCVGVDLFDQLGVARKFHNITYQCRDFETPLNKVLDGYDVLWCHDAFQYAVDPMATLGLWWQVANPNAMLMISVPQTILVNQRRLAYYLPSHAWYHHTLVSLIRMLATTGWDCRGGFFQQLPNDPWITAVVYKSAQAPRNPKNLTWYDIMETGLLPESADRSIHAHGHLRQQDLILPWLDKSMASMAQL